MSDMGVDQFRVEQPRVPATTEARVSNDNSKNSRVVRDKLDEAPLVYFLKSDGSLKVGNVLFENNQYISGRDFETYGKVEVHADENDKDKILYYVKTYRGDRAGELVPDPYGMFFKPTDLSVNLDQRGSRFCEYASVSREIFLTYQKYLTSRDPRLYKTIDKYFKDGDR